MKASVAATLTLALMLAPLPALAQSVGNLPTVSGTPSSSVLIPCATPGVANSTKGCTPAQIVAAGGGGSGSGSGGAGGGGGTITAVNAGPGLAGGGSSGSVSLALQYPNGTSGATTPLLNGVNTWSGGQTFSGYLNQTGEDSILGAGNNIRFSYNQNGNDAYLYQGIGNGVNLTSGVYQNSSGTNIAAAPQGMLLALSTTGLTFDVFSGATVGAAPTFVQVFDATVASLTYSPAGTSVFNVSAAGDLRSNGAVPALSSCGSGPTDALATDSAGTVIVGTGTVTTCVVTWATVETNKPTCVVSYEPGGTAPAYAVTTTTLSLTFAASAAGKVFDYVCLEH